MLCIPTDTRREFTCSVCNQTKPIPLTGGTGYGYDKDHNAVCYDCCADGDRKQMEESGRIVLYLTQATPLPNGLRLTRDNKVANWPGTLTFPLTCIKTGRHNIARVRYDVWFRDHQGKEWHGVQYGNNTQICHCRRMKG
jgi:hypothetical protein